MSAEDRLDGIDDLLRRLPVHDIDAPRAERTRRECLAQLEARAAASREGASKGWLEPAAVMALSLVYLAAAVQASLVLVWIAR